MWHFLGILPFFYHSAASACLVLAPLLKATCDVTFIYKSRCDPAV